MVESLGIGKPDSLDVDVESFLDGFCCEQDEVLTSFRESIDNLRHGMLEAASGLAFDVLSAGGREAACLEAVSMLVAKPFLNATDADDEFLLRRTVNQILVDGSTNFLGVAEGDARLDASLRASAIGALASDVFVAGMGLCHAGLSLRSACAILSGKEFSFSLFEQGNAYARVIGACSSLSERGRKN